MDKNQFTKLAKIAATLYVSSFLIINWNEVSWIFNYREVYGLTQDFFNPYPGIDETSMAGYFYPNRSSTVSAATTITPNTETQTQVAVPKTNTTTKQNVLEIPAIGIEAPIVFSRSANKTEITNDLNKGVVFYPGSVYPGQQGQIVILGHSAPAGWPKTKYEWVFSDLEDLKSGDLIYIDANGKQYTYIVRKTEIIARGADVPAYESVSGNGVLTLISCWPPGRDYQRIAVQAELLTE
jgi:LPXTG-site transpeptidase (sortase) family protein